MNRTPRNQICVRRLHPWVAGSGPGNDDPQRFASLHRICVRSLHPWIAGSGPGNDDPQRFAPLHRICVRFLLAWIAGSGPGNDDLIRFASLHRICVVTISNGFRRFTGSACGAYTPGLPGRGLAMTIHSGLRRATSIPVTTPLRWSSWSCASGFLRCRSPQCLSSPSFRGFFVGGAPYCFSSAVAAVGCISRTRVRASAYLGSSSSKRLIQSDDSRLRPERSRGIRVLIAAQLTALARL